MIDVEKYKGKDNESFEGISKQQLIDWCMKNDLPGNTKWAPEHPIWDAFLPKKPSPREAWYQREYITKAVDNMYWILNQCIDRNKEHDFVQRHMRSFQSCVVEDGEIVSSSQQMLQQVLTRFTVAKIAPKVTALSAHTMKKIINDSKIDISNGVYVPMAGFGGIKHAAELWFQDNFVFPINGKWDHLIECYDINESFCNWYGWTKRDMLQQIIHTDKTCLVCPPFGKTYEHWKGTPDEMADIGFVEWYKLIKKHVIAPNYIIIGPEIGGKGYDNSNKKMCGLFNKTTGIQLWTDDMIYGNDVK